jgi:hypothetical protein
MLGFGGPGEKKMVEKGDLCSSAWLHLKPGRRLLGYKNDPFMDVGS